MAQTSLRAPRHTLLGWHMGALVGLLLALIAVSLTTGALDLWRSGGGAVDTLMLSRLPRTAAAVLAGAGLAIAGQVMQALARNRLVDPSVTGTGQSAVLGLLVIALLWPGAPIGVKMAAAAACGLAGTAVFLVLCRRLPPTEPHLTPLVGLVFGGCVGAITAFLAWQTDMLQYLSIWASGEFSGIVQGRYELLWLGAPSVALVWWVADRLTLSSMGEAVGVGLGLDYRGTLRLGLVIVSVVTAVCVAVVGLLPFVGLVIPNLVSLFGGDNLRRTVPLVAVLGAILVLACDIAGRLIRAPYEIPAATLLGLVGAAVMLVLVVGRARHEG